MSTQQNILEIVDVILCETPLGLAAFCRTKVGHFFYGKAFEWARQQRLETLHIMRSGPTALNWCTFWTRRMCNHIHVR